MMRALTLWRPWPDAILRSTKRCENRGKPPPERLLGTVIALHAGLTYRVGDWAYPDGWVPPLESECPVGIVGVARLAGFLDLRAERRIGQALHVGDAGAIARRLWALDEDPWWTGPCGWLLDQVVAIKAVPCKGAMGIWTVPDDIAAVVDERVVAARAA